jgi:hypothetical protein
MNFMTYKKLTCTLLLAVLAVCAKAQNTGNLNKHP